MKKEQLNNVVDFRQVSNKKKYFLVVSDSECVLECWANSYLDLVGITNIYDKDEKAHKVNLVIDIQGRHIYQIKREED